MEQIILDSLNRTDIVILLWSGKTNAKDFHAINDALGIYVKSLQLENLDRFLDDYFLRESLKNSFTVILSGWPNKLEAGTHSFEFLSNLVCLLKPGGRIICKEEYSERNWEESLIYAGLINSKRVTIFCF